MRDLCVCKSTGCLERYRRYIPHMQYPVAHALCGAGVQPASRGVNVLLYMERCEYLYHQTKGGASKLIHVYDELPVKICASQSGE